MLATVVVQLPRREKAVELVVVRRVEGNGRADSFFLGLSSVLRAAGAAPQNMKHKSLVEWVSKPLSVTVGKQKIERASFQSRFPGEELFLKLGQVMGDGRADPSDTWYVPLAVAVFLYLRAACSTWPGTAEANDMMCASWEALLKEKTVAALAPPPQVLEW